MAKRRPSGDGMVRKKADGRWEGRIVVGHKKSGVPIFRYVYADTQRELLDKLHRAIENYRDVDLTEDCSLTLGEWLDRWLEEYKTETVRSSTLSGYRGYARNYIKPILGDKAISKITPADVQGMYNQLKDHGRVQKDDIHGQGLADATINRIHSMLHLAMKDAETAHIIAQNPLDQVADPKPNYKPMQILNEEQLDAFMAEVQKDEQWRDFFYTELTIGLRRGEICGLKWEDFDEAAGTLKVQRSASAKKAGKLAVGETKTDRGTRKIILPPTTANILRERKKAALTEWIFPNPLHPEEPMNPGRAYNHMKTLLKRAGLPSIRFHDLRHTFATHALASGVDAKTLASILGHTNASFTLDTYTHVTGDMQKRAAEIVGDFMADIFGEELKPWQESEKAAKAQSA